MKLETLLTQSEINLLDCKPQNYELFCSVANFDPSTDMSDCNNTWRNGLENEKWLRKEIGKLDCTDEERSAWLSGLAKTKAGRVSFSETFEGHYAWRNEYRALPPFAHHILQAIKERPAPGVECDMYEYGFMWKLQATQALAETIIENFDVLKGNVIFGDGENRLLYTKAFVGPLKLYDYRATLNAEGQAFIAKLCRDFSLGYFEVLAKFCNEIYSDVSYIYLNYNEWIDAEESNNMPEQNPIVGIKNIAFPLYRHNAAKIKSTVFTREFFLDACGKLNDLLGA